MYQIDFDEDKLYYDLKHKAPEFCGYVQSDIELYRIVKEILEIYSSDRLEIALKFFTLENSRISGICLKSFPKSQLSLHLLSKLNLCLGGDNGNELKHLPFEGTILEQPNLFIEAYYIYTDEVSKYRKEMMDKIQEENKRKHPDDNK